ncbi:hypothetical protein B0H16DRAFT_1592142, partial [Mycena metata]
SPREAAILQCAQLLLSAALQGPQYPTDQQTIGIMQCHCEARAWLHLGNTVGIIFSAYHGIYQFDLPHQKNTPKNRIPPILGKHIFPIRNLARYHICHHLALIFFTIKSSVDSSSSKHALLGNGNFVGHQAQLPSIAASTASCQSMPSPVRLLRCSPLRPDDNGSFGIKSTSLHFNDCPALWVIIRPCLLAD